MTTFIITVACAAGVACGLTGPMKHEHPAKSRAECYSAVIAKIKAFGQDTQNFTVRCDPK